jgi:predicted lipoprotein
MKKYFLFIIILFISCSEDKDLPEYDPVDESYNRFKMMENLTDNIIIPSLENLDSKLKDFNTSLNSFNSDTSLDNLSALRSDFLEAYKAWQHVEMFNIGKAEEIYYNLKSNVYPVNVARIMANMDNPNLDLDDCSDTKPNNCSAQGFPTLDYLLYGIGDNDDSILLEYKNESVNYKEYLNTVAQKLTSNTSIVLDDLKLNKDNFISSTDNTMTSNLNMLINDFVYYYEKGLRTNKFGIPAGVWTFKRPQNVESFYAQNISKELALEALSACKKFFMGTKFGSESDNGESFKSYIDYLDTENNLSTLISDSFDNSTTEINALGDSFSNQVNNDNTKMLETFDALQVTVRYLKTDMLSLMGVDVDYVDADGD